MSPGSLVHQTTDHTSISQPVPGPPLNFISHNFISFDFIVFFYLILFLSNFKLDEHTCNTAQFDINFCDVQGQDEQNEPCSVNNINIISILAPTAIRLPRHVSRPRGIVERNLSLIPVTPMSLTPPSLTVNNTGSRELSSLNELQTARGLKLMHLNVRSLLPKLDFINILINDVNPDILIISETWLSSRTCDDDVAMSGYNTFRIDRKAKGGGVIAYVREHLVTTVSIAVSTPKCFECIVLNVCVGGDTHLSVSGVYRPPSAPSSALNDLGKVLANFNSSELVILGDLNQDWLTESSSFLKQLCLELDLTQLILHPTRPNTKNPTKSTLIDIILTNRPAKYPQSGVFAQDVSDHCPIACVRLTKAFKPKTHFIKKRNFKNFTDQGFLHDLYHSDLERLCLVPDPELATEHFSLVFNAIANKHAPYKSLRVKNRSSPWFTDDVKSVIRLKDLAWSKARATGNSADWLEFRKLRNICVRTIRTAKSGFYLAFLQNTQGNTATFWKTVKSLQSTSSSALPTQISGINGITSSQLELCEAFNQHFISAGHLFDRLHTNVNSPAIGPSPHVKGPPPVPSIPACFSFRTISVHEVRKALLKLDIKKSKGEDEIAPFFLRLSAHLIAAPIAHIFNLTFISGEIPAIWKTAQVLPLFKSGDHTDLNNYRPISKLCCLAKVLETLANHQLRAFLDSHNILQSNQSGFRPGHSTVTATSLVVNDILNDLDTRQHCAALFIDLSKAFDTVDHDILLTKLSHIGLDGPSIRWFTSYLTGRKQAVVASNVKSSSLFINKGVPQGSVLGPVLFTLYINNIFFPSGPNKIHYYADDTILYCSGSTLAQAVTGLQTVFDSFQLSLSDLKLVLNSQKTKWMLFSRTHSISDNLSICTLQGEKIDSVLSYKYLGIWLDTKLSYQSHIDHLIKKLRRIIGFLYRNKACFSFHSRKTIVQSLLLSVLDYGDIVYMHASSSTLKLLDAVYHSALRFVTGDGFLTHHCTLYENVGWTSLSTRRELHCLTFIYKALLGELPSYLSLLISRNSINYQTRSQSYIRLFVPRVRTEQGKTAFSFYAPSKWNLLQNNLKLDELISLESFKQLLKGILQENCSCFI